MKKTISSLALLKVNWDMQSQRKDFVDNFVPFVATLINRKNYDTIDPSIICKDFESEFGLKIPYHPMMTILSRTLDIGYIRKSHLGNFIPNMAELSKADITASSLEQERKFKNVINEFVKFCEKKHSQKLTESDAENALITFLKEHDLDILFISQNIDTLLPIVVSSISHEYMINDFIISASKSEPEVFNYIVDISIGHIIVNTLLCEELDKFQGDLSKCNLYLDVGLLFNIFGINGEAKKSAFIDFVQMLISNKAQLFVFVHTYEEFKGILENCLNWIDNANYDPRKASRALVYFKESNYTSSDVEQFIINIDRILNEFKIIAIDVPGPLDEKSHQMDDKGLTDQIIKIYKSKVQDFDEFEKEDTIYKDVKSISAIYKLRKGERPQKIQDTKYVFITTNSSLAYASNKFESHDEDYQSFFIPTTLTDVFVGTIIWLQTPAKVTQINQKRLIANCYAALQPTAEMIKRLAEKADQLEKGGKITGNDVILLKQSRIARNILQKETLGDPNRFTDDTPLEILHQIRTDIQKEENDKFKKERDEFQNKEKLLSDKIESERQLKIQAEQTSQQTEKELQREQNEKEEIKKKIETISNVISSMILYVFYFISFAALAFFLNSFLPGILEKIKLSKIVFIIISCALSAIFTIIGFKIKDIGKKIRISIKKKIQSFFRIML